METEIETEEKEEKKRQEFDLTAKAKKILQVCFEILDVTICVLVAGSFARDRNGRRARSTGPPRDRHLRVQSDSTEWESHKTTKRSNNTNPEDTRTGEERGTGVKPKGGGSLTPLQTQSTPAAAIAQ